MIREAISGRGIPPSSVAPRSHMPNVLPRRALPRGSPRSGDRFTNHEDTPLDGPSCPEQLNYNLLFRWFVGWVRYLAIQPSMKRARRRRESLASSRCSRSSYLLASRADRRHRRQGI